MKLRIRFQSRREIVEIPNPECSLEDLIGLVGSHFLLVESTFGLSLDGKNLLTGEENSTLTDLGIVGGDLLHVITNNSFQEPSLSTRLCSQDTQNTNVNQCNSLPLASSSNSEGSLSVPSTSNNIYKSTTNQDKKNSQKVIGTSEKTCKRESPSCKEKIDKEGESTDMDAQAGPSCEEKQIRLEYTPRVLLCRDGIPHSLQSSYEVAGVVTMHQAVCVAVHVLMLETGFINFSSQDTDHHCNKDPSTSSKTESNTNCLTAPIISQHWKTNGGAKFSYVHPACPGLICNVVCASFGPYVLAHGMSNSPACNEVHPCKLSAADFVKGNVDIKSSGAVDVYKNLQRLSMAVKDQLAYPLLSSMRHELNLEEIYGFMALPTEVKEYKRQYKDYMERRQDSQRMTFVVPGQGVFDPSVIPGPYPPFSIPGMHGGRHDLFPAVPFMPGGINPGTLPGPGNLPRPRFDPFGPLPDMDFNPAPNRRRPGRGGGRGGFPPGPFF